MSPLYFFLKNLATFFSRQFCGITPGFFFSKADDFFAHRSHYHYRLLLLSLGCHPLECVTPHLFYPSDLVSPLFFVNLPTEKFFLRVSPPGGCHPGRSPRPRLVTPLLRSQSYPLFCHFQNDGASLFNIVH